MINDHLPSQQTTICKEIETPTEKLMTENVSDRIMSEPTRPLIPYFSVFPSSCSTLRILTASLVPARPGLRSERELPGGIVHGGKTVAAVSDSTFDDEVFSEN